MITALVPVLPFCVRIVEHNLKSFSCSWGSSLSPFQDYWSWDLVIDVIKAPVMIGFLPLKRLGDGVDVFYSGSLW
jgi:predicted cation transporter